MERVSALSVLSAATSRPVSFSFEQSGHPSQTAITKAHWDALTGRSVFSEEGILLRSMHTSAAHLLRGVCAMYVPTSTNPNRQ